MSKNNVENVNEEINLDINEQILLRKEKLKVLEKKGIAYPNDFKRKDLAKDIINAHAKKEKEALTQENNKVIVAGRIMTRRLMGKASFVHIQDMSGRIQVYIRKNDLEDEDMYDEFKTWDLGDIVGIEGVVFKTQTQELSIKASSIRLLTKSLRPLPDKWHGLQDLEVRYRQRYLDLIVNEKSREVFFKRTKIIQAMRDFFIERGFIDVETPMMQVIPGGAAARPFITHHNALDMDLYLRIAPELYLKRLVVGGFEKVFEINRNFRNEGLSTRHNPEFTMIEFYQAYADYKDLMDLTEKLFYEIASALSDDLIIEYQGEKIDFSKPFERLTIKEAILKYNKEISMPDLEDKEKISAIIKAKDGAVDKNWGLGKLQLELFEIAAEAKLIQPTFIIEFAIEVSPLARANDQNPDYTDRFELFIAGKEIANGFSELNDPIDQANRFKKQVEEKEAGDVEAMHYDADYIRALEYGLPPTAGEGIGIDRLVMLFTDSTSIRDVLLFPHMRHE